MWRTDSRSVSDSSVRTMGQTIIIADEPTH
eukprot:COSAG03_NODE_23315_length_281_cov_0.571429_1_plen_29_part_10